MQWVVGPGKECRRVEYLKVADSRPEWLENA